MKTIHVSGTALDVSSAELCIQTIRSGGILCYPTETYYALGIDPFHSAALSKLYRAKKRPAEKALPLIASSRSMVSDLCDTEDSRFDALASQYWPGPLTLILPARDHSTNYAVRVSSNAIARQLAEGFGAPIVSTSANVSGEPAVQNPQLLPSSVTQYLDILIHSGLSPGGPPSTIVSLLERPGKILREGAIPASEIVSLL